MGGEGQVEVKQPKVCGVSAFYSLGGFGVLTGVLPVCL